VRGAREDWESSARRMSVLSSVRAWAWRDVGRAPKGFVVDIRVRIGIVEWKISG